MESRCHKNILKFIKKTGLILDEVSRYKKQMTRWHCQQNGVPADTKNLQTSVIWEERKKYEESAERNFNAW
jgi:hypothetical protein